MKLKNIRNELNTAEIYNRYNCVVVCPNPYI